MNARASYASMEPIVSNSPLIMRSQEEQDFEEDHDQPPTSKASAAAGRKGGEPPLGPAKAAKPAKPETGHRRCWGRCRGHGRRRRPDLALEERRGRSLEEGADDDDEEEVLECWA
ncbi:unnamed protein product [Prorocentrum cordatum]|uniref:Uncharacterized protein n=1 Tax=Prorocentrum cordatum TaxID=2364126 RepID=A0ABN9SX57_9DINO|nr:unnamed protein product [Polarella glacialis]